MALRSRLESCFDILEAIERGVAKPKQIMRNTNLSWATLKEIFESLNEGSFIREEAEENTKRYQMTKKGRNALFYYLKSLNEPIDVEQFFNR